MSAATEHRAATYADLEALPPGLVGELIDGEVVASPRPGPRHALASSALGALLGGPFQFGVGGPGGWWTLDEPELHLGADVLVPDLAGWRVERMPALPTEAWFELRPDWVCEVLSPSTERIDRLRKLALYARAGVPHVWLLHPEQRTLEIFALESGTWRVTIVDGEAPVRATPFEAVELAFPLLWATPTAPG